jgi:hypothetical protein
MHNKGLLRKIKKLGECFGFYENAQGLILGCGSLGYHGVGFFHCL